MSGLSRRDALATGLFGAAAIGLGPKVIAAPSRQKKAKNIILCVSDGMSHAVPSTLNMFLQGSERKKSLWAELSLRPDVAHGYQITRSLSSVVTDSAAASSSWGSGQHVWNGQLNVFPDGTQLKTLFQVLREKTKMKLGLVTTATITHATPAGMAVNNLRRDDEAGIAASYLDLGIDVLMGGGRRFFDRTTRSDGRDLLGDYQKAGYRTIQDRSGLNLSRRGQKALGLFSVSHMPYEVDRLNVPRHENVPSLLEMTERALHLLDGNSDGFFLQVEGARVDHAAHGNDFAGVMYDQLAFEDAVAACIAFAERTGDTLVVVTSDHGNSCPSVLGQGSEYGDSTDGMMTLGGMKMSYEELMPAFGGTNAVEANVRDLVKQHLGIALEANEVTFFTNALKGAAALKDVTQYSIAQCHLSLAMANHTAICWSGRQHTNEWTMVSAFGPGAEAFSGLTENITWFDKFLAHRDLSVKNPTMDFETAKRYHEASSERARILASVENHWI